MLPLSLALRSASRHIGCLRVEKHPHSRHKHKDEERDKEQGRPARRRCLSLVRSSGIVYRMCVCVCVMTKCVLLVDTWTHSLSYGVPDELEAICRTSEDCVLGFHGCRVGVRGFGGVGGLRLHLKIVRKPRGCWHRAMCSFQFKSSKGRYYTRSVCVEYTLCFLVPLCI